MATAATMPRGSKGGALSRLIAALLLLAFGFQSYMAQTHIHDIVGKAPVALVHHAGHDRVPVQNSLLDCPFCQMLTHAGSLLVPDPSLVLPLPQWITLTAWHHDFAKMAIAANHDWQSRAPPSA
jgi:hypothetical protein